MNVMRPSLLVWTASLALMAGCEGDPVPAGQKRRAAAAKAPATKATETAEAPAPAATPEASDPAPTPKLKATAPPKPDAQGVLIEHNKITTPAWVIEHVPAEATAVSTGESSPSTVALWDEGREREACAKSAAGKPHSYTLRGRLLSVVGDYVSYESVEHADCGGREGFEFHGMTTVDLSSGKAVMLDELFDVDAIAQALAQAPFLTSVREAKEKNPDTVPCALDVVLPEPNTTQFGFHHLDDGDVIVRIGMSHESDLCRGNFATVDIKLKPKAELHATLTKAQASKLLMAKLAPEAMREKK